VAVPRVPTRNLAMTCVGHFARVPTFDNLDDDSLLGVQKIPSPKRIAEKRTCPSPSMSGEFLLFQFHLFPHALITIL
jgi:hypothetical protein